MKPHEETWEFNRGYIMSHGGQQIVGSMSEPRGVLAAAAPEMAIMKILLDDANGYVVSVDHLNEAREALRKAGVL